ncbi:hypothetical protein AWM68_02875 [Fictibacillus phosphorivorans]|uniref:Uncharacterized protein n=1 Tax=Fictibacillus phosphorivorans TaxID=1221500 RepID=A0A163SJH0_9BACL|nr:hypothetical protein [Fictibacillus phosphorivorans]KZE69228.1 hypothetical protein AWM68_02875 [Fictibacillus phosphorivorans]
MEKCVYFNDSFFSSGRTEIYNASQEKLGELDLKSAFSSSVNVENEKGEIVVEGGFPFFSSRWIITQADGTELGEVKSSFAFFSKRFRYSTNDHTYEIESPAFSKEYTILDDNKAEVATFRKINGFFQSAAFELTNHSDVLRTEELIAVVMGVNAIEKRNQSSAGGVNGGA